MIGLEKLLTSSLSEWLQDPVIRVSVLPAQEVAALQLQIQDLQLQLQEARHQNEILMSRYSSELNLNFKLQDILKDHGIKWR